MTQTQKAINRFLANGGEVQQCPLGYAVAPVANTIQLNPLARGVLVYDGTICEIDTSGCRSTIRQDLQLQANR